MGTQTCPFLLEGAAVEGVRPIQEMVLPCDKADPNRVSVLCSSSRPCVGHEADSQGLHHLSKVDMIIALCLIVHVKGEACVRTDCRAANDASSEEPKREVAFRISPQLLELIFATDCAWPCGVGI